MRDGRAHGAAGRRWRRGSGLTLSTMRIALAQITERHRPAANLAPGRGVHAPRRRRRRHAGVVPRGDDVPVRGAAGADRRAPGRPWAVGVRAIAERAGIVVVAGMFVPAGDGRRHQHPDRDGPGRRRPLRQDPPLRRVRLRRIAHRRTGPRTGDDHGRRRSGLDVGLTTCYDVRFPELYVELARRGAH